MTDFEFVNEYVISSLRFRAAQVSVSLWNVVVFVSVSLSNVVVLINEEPASSISHF